MATSGSDSGPNNNGNGLLLYQSYPCYYCQKVVMALNEKSLKFRSHYLNLYKGEHFSPWFLRMNPTAEVPVLKDGVKVIPDSERIIDYLEDNFSNGNTPRLRLEKGSDRYQKMEQILQQLNNVQESLIYYGCLSFPDLTSEMKTRPYEVKRALAKYSVNMEILRENAEKYPEFRSIYEDRKHVLQRFWARVQDRGEVEKELDELENILDEMELELSTHADREWWLCDKKFTIADVHFAVLLNKLHELGLWKRYFGSSKRPLTDSYFRSLQHRESFKKTFNQNSGFFKSFCCAGSKDKMFRVGSFVVIIGLVGIGIYMYQRKK